MFIPRHAASTFHAYICFKCFIAPGIEVFIRVWPIFDLIIIENVAYSRLVSLVFPFWIGNPCNWTCCRLQKSRHTSLSSSRNSFTSNVVWRLLPILFEIHVDVDFVGLIFIGDMYKSGSPSLANSLNLCCESGDVRCISVGKLENNIAKLDAQISQNSRSQELSTSNGQIVYVCRVILIDIGQFRRTC